MLKRTTHGPVRCAWPGGCTQEAGDPHELLSRARGGSITEPANIVLLCRGHHSWVTVHPAAAEAMGMALPSPPTRSTVTQVSDAPSSPAKPGRRHLSVRITAAGTDTIAAFMADTGATESEVVRAMLHVATRHPREVTTRIRAAQEART